MANPVRSAIVQTEWTGDKDSMIERNADYARKAAEQGAQVMCFQELFYSPYFCQVQEDDHFDYAEPIPDGPTTQLMQDLAKETGMVLVVPIFEKEDDGFFYNTAAVIDADGTYPARYIPEMLRALEQADLVVGARVGSNVHIPLTRRPAKWALNKLANFVSASRIVDMNSGLRLFRRDVVMQYFPILPDQFSWTTTLSLSMHCD